MTTRPPWIAPAVFASLLFSVLTAPAAVAQCTGDLNHDGIVDGADLGLLLAAWGGAGSADINHDGLVDGADLGILLGQFGAPCPPSPTPLKLAGNALNAWPWFEFVQDFNVGATMKAAVDTLRLPSLAGANADLYVVEKKTLAQWTASPSLADVRGAPQAVTLAAGGIQSNIITITGSAALSATDGDKPGKAYDLVFDVNRNGVLDVGDLIDGFSDTPGFSVIPNLTLAGPHGYLQPADYAVTGPPTGYTMERLYYPADLASLGPRPLCVISHGNGHDYRWYDYLGQHLASWGYIVMSHQNNTMPGIETASTTTLLHTTAIIQQQATIAGGVLNGKIDTSTIVWIGHSRGGEGVVRAFDKLFDATYTPPAGTYSKTSIKLLCSIAPTDFLGKGGVGSGSDPHTTPLFLIYGAADGDVCGCPGNNVADSFNIFERAQGNHWSTYIHGVDHNDFNCCGVNDFQGPAGSAIGSAEAQKIAKVHILAAIKNQLESSPAAHDLTWRQYGSNRPLGVLATATVRIDQSPLATGLVSVIDDFQSQSATTISSSGGAVSFTVTNLTEGLADEANTAFTWASTDPFNGNTRLGTGDAQRGIVFDWNAASQIEWTVPAALSNFSNAAFLQLRAAQGTRHPNVTAADSSFTVTLIDQANNMASLTNGAYLQGIGRPYQRTGSGTGSGWQNEMQCVRLRLDDFKRNATPIDLTNIAKIRISFGGAGNTSTGRLVVDDLALIHE